MSCVLSEIRFTKFLCRRGSISAETAIILPFVFLVFFLFFSVFQYIAAYLNVSQTADLTARYMSYYACIYYEEGVSKISAGVADKISDIFGEQELLSADVFDDIGSTFLCSAMAESVFDSFLKKNDNAINRTYKIKDISFAGSSFFEDDNSFELKICCSVDTFFPLPKFFGNGYLVKVCISGKGWTNGSYYIKPSEPSVWDLDNFDRGRAIEKYIGCNLPEDYPVIDMYNKATGTVSLVKSIDHTSKSYLKTEQLKKTLNECLTRLVQFNGSDKLIDNSYTISSAGIKKREIILVVPTNDMTKAQMMAVAEFAADCASRNVNFIINRYQVSK